jgi:cobalt/nickel transport system permease protein
MPEGTRDASRCGSPALGIQLQAVHRCNEVATEPVKEGHVHIPDGFINASTSLGAGAVAAGGLGVSLRRTAQTLQDKQAPLAGLVAPWAGAICVAVVLLVQALFADGGLTALGLNITNMALVGGVGGYGVFLLLRKALPATKAAVTGAAGVAAGISVVLASIAFVVEYAIGGAGGASVGTVAAAMVGVHTLIGIGEGIITALTVGVVLGVRPDLVHGAADLRAPLLLETAGR